MLKIYARNTIIKQIDVKQANTFIKTYHRQGLPRMSKRRYDIGLFHQDTLVGEASFSSPRTREKAKKYQQELIRMTFKTDVQIIGGASKMIKYYIDTFKPRNFFTYQTMSGKKSDVYEKSNMQCVETEHSKSILVKNGYTYNSAVKEHQAKNTKYLYLNAQLMNLGPDHILHTRLGEKFNVDGSRKTNKQLFIEYCGYHEEIIPGDRVYVYENPNYYHYVYEITNNDPTDDHYYIGRHSDYSDHTLVISDLLVDGYMGSGGNKFQNWKQQTEQNNYALIKTILYMPDTWTKTVQLEAKCIGDKYKTDPNCLNSVAGGTAANVSFSDMINNFTKDTCKKHGFVTFKDGHCLVCQSLKPLHKQYCNIHGLTTFTNDKCLKCITNAAKHLAYCDTHGKTLFSGQTCAKCSANKSIVVNYCSLHGSTKFHKDKCIRCILDKNAQTTLKQCSTHGLTKFRGDSCMKCWIQNQIYTDKCPKHGKTTFRSGNCLNCQNTNTIYQSVCSKHGRTKFKGGKCCKCIAEKTYHDAICPKHGKTTFVGDICLKCKNQNAITYKYCDKCEKVTGWNGNTCMSCTNKKMYHEKECPIHGLTKFRGNTCMKCVSAKKPKKPKKVHVTERKYCDKCKKDTRHVDGKCMSCAERALYHQAECPIHGLTKFRANKCCACRAAKMREDRKRKKLAKQNTKQN